MRDSPRICISSGFCPKVLAEFRSRLLKHFPKIYALQRNPKFTPAYTYPAAPLTVWPNHCPASSPISYLTLSLRRFISYPAFGRGPALAPALNKALASRPALPLSLPTRHVKSPPTATTAIVSAPSPTAMTGAPLQGDQPPQLDLARINRAWRAFMAYRRLSLQVFDAQALSFESLSDEAKALIPAVPIRLSHAAEAIEHNADVMERIAALAGISQPFALDQLHPDDLAQTVADFPDVVDGLVSISRDWSAVSQKDRALCYDHVIRAVEEAAQDALSAGTVEKQADFSVLVPGASLGRLAWELANRGMTVQGVESSYLHLFMCNYIMNGSATSDNPLHLYPFAHHTGMALSVNDQCKEVEFPDTTPRDVDNPNFSMVAGEFLEIHREEDSWDCVATCFFVENSHSIISCVRRIAKILKPGGIWVNHGSLDFRYDDSETEPSVEITAEELELVIQRAGMRIMRKEELTCKPPFAVNDMINEEYKSIFTVAVRE